MVDASALSSNDRCSVIAPAGCGKTELIAQTVRDAQAERVLVLTHTHAGVKALRDRLLRLGVNRRAVQVDTIAGWCLRYASSYPSGSGLVSTEPVKGEWENVYDAANVLLRTRAIRSVVEASYSAVYVDEYQDCTPRQHEVVKLLADILPCRVLGDPLQGIFGFAGGTLSWASDVESAFPRLGELSTPWRWSGKNEALGKWLLSIRPPLIDGAPIDLSKGPTYWAASTAENQRKVMSRLARGTSQVVAVRKWPKDAHEFARNLGGLVTSMEEMDCNDLLGFAEVLDRVIGTRRALAVVGFAADCMTTVSSTLGSALDCLRQGKVPSPSRYKKNTDIVEALVALTSDDDPIRVRVAMQRIEKMKGAKLFRRELWTEAKRTVLEIEHGRFPSYRQAAWTLRNRLRYSGRALERRIVSRTLLIKGLEFEHALILRGDEFEDRHRPGDGAKHFYVAATRGAVSLSVLSPQPQLQFSAARI